jgi:hypothetical protein
LALVSSGSSIFDDFFHLASQAIKDTESSEGALRTAISRAYYAVFLTARDQLFGPDETGLTSSKRKKLRKKFGQKKRPVGSHDWIIFAISDIKPTVTVRPLTLQSQVSQLKEARVHADYHFTSQNLQGIPYNTWREYATKVVELASQVLPVARQLPPYP